MNRGRKLFIYNFSLHHARSFLGFFKETPASKQHISSKHSDKAFIFLFLTDLIAVTHIKKVNPKMQPCVVTRNRNSPRKPTLFLFRAAASTVVMERRPCEAFIISRQLHVALHFQTFISHHAEWQEPSGAVAGRRTSLHLSHFFFLQRLIQTVRRCCGARPSCSRRFKLKTSCS